MFIMVGLWEKKIVSKKGSSNLTATSNFFSMLFLAVFGIIILNLRARQDFGGEYKVSKIFAYHVFVNLPC